MTEASTQIRTSDSFEEIEEVANVTEHDCSHNLNQTEKELVEETKEERHKKTTLILFASCSIFLFAGSFYGWGPMQLLLEKNGNFGTECDHIESHNNTNTNENVVCTEQTAALLNCRFVSQLTVLTGPLLGYISDRYGGATLTYFMGISVISGLTLLIVAIEFPGTVWDSILYLAFVLMGLGSTSGGLLTVETGLLFRDRVGGTTSKAQSRVISLLNSLFDAGAMTYLGLWGLEKVTSSNNQSSNVNLVAILGSYLLTAVLSIGGYAWNFRRALQSEQDEAEGKEKQQAAGAGCDGEPKLERSECTISMRLSSTIVSQMFENDDEKSKASNGDNPEFVLNQEISKSSSSRGGKEEEFQAPADAAVPSQLRTRVNSNYGDVSYVPISQRSVIEQLKSQAYLFLCIIFSFHMVSNVWTLTTARDFLKHLGDDEFGNRYLSIFTLMTPVSLVALPFVDVAIHKFGFAWALQGVNALGMLHSIIKVSTSDLNVQIVGFVIFSFFRCFLFAVTFSCLASFTSSFATGRAVGILYVVSGAASFINIGLAGLAVERMNGDFFVPNIIFVVLTVPMIFLVHVMGKALARDDFHKTNPESQSLV